MARPEFRQLLVNRNLAFSHPLDVYLAQVGRASIPPAISAASFAIAGRRLAATETRNSASGASSPIRCVVSDRPQSTETSRSGTATERNLDP